MKRVKSSPRRSSKGKAAPKSVDAYLATVPEPARTTLQKVRAAIRSALPADATEGISYQIPAFLYKGPLVWYAAFSDHCSLFPTAAVISAFKGRTPKLQHLQRNHPLPHRQTSPGHAPEEDGEDAPRRQVAEEAALIACVRAAAAHSLLPLSSVAMTLP